MKISPVILNNYYVGNSAYSNTCSSLNAIVGSNCHYDKYNAGLDINFGYYFKLKQIKGVPCAYCGKPMLTRGDIKKITTLRGVELVNEIEKFVSQNPSAFSSNTKEAIKSFELLAMSFPQKNGKEILPIAYTVSRTRMIHKQLDIYNKVLEYASEIGCQELTDYINKVKEQDVILKPDISMEDLSNFLINKIQVEYRKGVISNVVHIVGKFSKKENIDSITNLISIISRLPSSKTDPDAYLVKYISKALRKDPKIDNQFVSMADDEAILFYSTLLLPCLSSAEHVKPYSDNGKSNPSNYLATHVWCNSKRESTKFSKFVTENPVVLRNILKYLRYIYPSNNQKTYPVKYFNDIRANLNTELDCVKDNQVVASFLNELNSLHLKPHSTIYTATDKNTIASVVELVNSAIASDLGHHNRDAALDNLYEQCINSYVNSRREKIAKLIKKLDNDADSSLIFFVYKQMESLTPSLFIDKSKNELNDILSDNFIYNQKQLLQDSIRTFLGDEFENFNQDRLMGIIKKVCFKKTPELFCIKVLLNSKNNDGSYDFSKISKYLSSGIVQ